MKTLLLVALIVISANNSSGSEDGLADKIKTIMATGKKIVQDNKLDPLKLDDVEIKFALHNPETLSGKVKMQKLSVAGVSNVVTKKLDYNEKSHKLSLDISIPSIDIAYDKLNVDVKLLGKSYKLESKVTVSILQPRISGDMKVVDSPDPKVESSSLKFDLKGIDFDGSVKFENVDYAPKIKKLLTNTIPFILNFLKGDINNFVNKVLKEVTPLVLAVVKL